MCFRDLLSCDCYLSRFITLVQIQESPLSLGKTSDRNENNSLDSQLCLHIQSLQISFSSHTENNWEETSSHSQEELRAGNVDSFFNNETPIRPCDLGNETTWTPSNESSVVATLEKTVDSSEADNETDKIAHDGTVNVGIEGGEKKEDDGEENPTSAKNMPTPEKETDVSVLSLSVV